MDKSENFDQILVKELRLSRRTFNALNRNRVFTVGKLKELLRANELEKFYSIGKKA